MAESEWNRFKGSLLVLAGEADVVVPMQSVEFPVEETCNMLQQQKWSESLEMATYSGINHFPVIQASQTKWLEWVKDRFSGGVVSGSGCTKVVVEGFRTYYTECNP